MLQESSLKKRRSLSKFTAVVDKAQLPPRNSLLTPHASSVQNLLSSIGDLALARQPSSTKAAASSKLGSKFTPKAFFGTASRASKKDRSTE
jgi:hypothetical protein